jgi:hypothetical protein
MTPPAAASSKPRPRKKAAQIEPGGIYHGEVVEMKPEGAARRIFKGVKLPDVPMFTLESASDPDVTVEFTGIAALPGLPALQLVTDGITMHTLPSFFQEILGDEQYEKFTTFANDPINGITLDVLIELATYLMEEYTNRPTEGSTGS